MKEKQRQPQPDGAIISNLRYAYGMLFREYPIPSPACFCR